MVMVLMILVVPIVKVLNNNNINKGPEEIIGLEVIEEVSMIGNNFNSQTLVKMISKMYLLEEGLDSQIEGFEREVEELIEGRVDKMNTKRIL